jgi:hypothetical protein
MDLGKFLFIGLITVKIKAKNKEDYSILKSLFKPYGKNGFL